MAWGPPTTKCTGGNEFNLAPSAESHGCSFEQQGQVGVAGRIRATHLGPGAQAAGRRDTDEGGTVGGRPGHIDRSLVTGDQPLVGVDQRIGDRGKTPGVLHDAGDVVIGNLRQLQRTFLIKEGVGAVER